MASPASNPSIVPLFERTSRVFMQVRSSRHDVVERSIRGGAGTGAWRYSDVVSVFFQSTWTAESEVRQHVRFFLSDSGWHEHTCRGSIVLLCVGYAALSDILATLGHVALRSSDDHSLTGCPGRAVRRGRCVIDARELMLLIRQVLVIFVLARTLCLALSRTCASCDT